MNMTIEELRESATLLSRMASNAERLQRALVRVREEWEHIPADIIPEPDDLDGVAAVLELTRE